MKKIGTSRYTYITVIAVLSFLLVISLIINGIQFVGRNDNNVSETSDDLSIPEVTDAPDTVKPEETTEAVTHPVIKDEESKLIAAYGEAATENFGKLADRFNALLEYLEISGRPTRTYTVEKITVDEDGEKTSDVDPITVTYPAEVAFAYIDLTTGYTFSYNADEVFFGASLVKLPYIYCVLKEIEAFEQHKHDYASDGSALYDADGNPLFDGAHPNYDENGNILYLEGEEKYDLGRKWTYDSGKDFVEGSGVIQNEDDGFSLTYLELIQYALKYSDNIAFGEIQELFGRQIYFDWAEKVGIKGVNNSSQKIHNLSANDCLIAMDAVYDYLETDSKYAAAVKSAMLSTQHRVMIPSAVSPLECANKYGWDKDSYHDMAIVYDEHPFAVVVMTDLDEGRSEDNAYIRNITKEILDIHNSFYK